MGDKVELAEHTAKAKSIKPEFVLQYGSTDTKANDLRYFSPYFLMIYSMCASSSKIASSGNFPLSITSGICSLAVPSSSL